MTFPVWTKPGIYGALVGAIAATFLGFMWGGWTTERSAAKVAESVAADAVTMAMVPVCLDKSTSDPDQTSKLATIRDANTFNRRKAIMATGWATIPGANQPDRDLAEACLAGLDVDAS